MNPSPSINPRPIRCASGPVVIVPRWRLAVSWRLAMLAGGLLITQPGCTTLLTAGGLQEAFHESGDAPTVAVYDATSDDAGEADATDMAVEPKTEEPFDPRAAEDALDEALERLSASGRLTSATADALNAAVEQAPPQDWPDIIDAFVATIESTPGPQRTAMRPVEAPQVEPAAPSETTSNEPVAVSAPKTDAIKPVANELDQGKTTPETAAEPDAAEEPTTASQATVVPQTESRLTVVNPCFASRVRGWGAVDRFDSSRFQPGQEVIVYFELDKLVGDPSPDGHTTRVDTALQLVAADGRRLHEWRFEPLQETCLAPRRDYFARYVVRLPDTIPAGECRLDLAVTDEVAHATAHASLPLEIAGKVQ